MTAGSAEVSHSCSVMRLSSIAVNIRGTETIGRGMLCILNLNRASISNDSLPISLPYSSAYHIVYQRFLREIRGCSASLQAGAPQPGASRVSAVSYTHLTLPTSDL